MNKKYWLRGAIIVVTFHAVLSMILFSLCRQDCGLAGLAFPNVFLGIPMIWLTGLLRITALFGYNSLIWLWLTLYWFGIGAFLGWIFGKLPRNFKIFFSIILTILTVVLIAVSFIIIKNAFTPRPQQIIQPCPEAYQGLPCK